ncbi:hypothetical protein GUJ93_ZPchr0001g32188 [Zizania palustris]|uniref:Uncharacterized protein n=1 Tax=Zizania palustris TaxID=103762 RepID=A0A8J5RWX2_ZIZPA|nr:hypothetical protein GUJ93_ZPchr0001g32188 [Zizania palustris]
MEPWKRQSKQHGDGVCTAHVRQAKEWSRSWLRPAVSKEASAALSLELEMATVIYSSSSCRRMWSSSLRNGSVASLLMSPMDGLLAGPGLAPGRPASDDGD